MKFFLAFCCIFAGYSSAWAQDSDLPPMGKTFEGGIVFGGNITQVDGDTYSGYHKIGIQAGGSVNVNFTHWFGIGMEMLYAQKGSRGANVKESLALGTYFDKYYLNLNYIEIPLLLRYRMAFADIEGGISYARLVSSKEWVDADVPVVIKPELNSFRPDDYNYVAGICVHLGNHWQAGARYQYSVQPIRTWDRLPARYSQYGVNEYNNVVVFRIRYIL